jgi:hypothetical protein
LKNASSTLPMGNTLSKFKNIRTDTDA